MCIFFEEPAELFEEMHGSSSTGWAFVTGLGSRRSLEIPELQGGMGERWRAGIYI